MSKYFLAVDIGASSGRHILGSYENGKIELEEVHRFFDTTQSIVCQSVDNYLERNFKNLSVNFGCTGGQHRSVFFAQKTAKFLHEKYPNIKVVLNHVVQHKNYVYETK